MNQTSTTSSSKIRQLSKVSELSAYQAIELKDHWTIELKDHWTIELKDHWTIGDSDYKPDAPKKKQKKQKHICLICIPFTIILKRYSAGKLQNSAQMTSC